MFLLVKGKLKWSYYDFWDLGNSLGIYKLYAYILKLFKISMLDYYKSNHFVILHTHLGSATVNYTMRDWRERSTLNKNTTKKYKKSFSSLELSSRNNNRVEFCKDILVKYVATSSMSEFIDSREFESSPEVIPNSSSWQLTRNRFTYLDCFDLIADKKFILNLYFYDFSHNLWKNCFLNNRIN